MQSFIYIVWFVSCKLFRLSFTSIFHHMNTYRTFYIVGYAISSILLGVMAFIRSYGLASFGVRSSFSLHGGVLRSVLRAPMSFFDTTPTGRILARFSKDMHTVDSEIADFLDIFVVRLRLLFWFIFVQILSHHCSHSTFFSSSCCS